MIKSGKYYVEVFLGGDKSVGFKNCGEGEMERIVSLVNEQGPPFKVAYRDGDFVIINPDKVSAVSVRALHVECPTCGTTSSYAIQKSCTTPEYHE